MSGKLDVDVYRGHTDVQKDYGRYLQKQVLVQPDITALPTNETDYRGGNGNS